MSLNTTLYLLRSFPGVIQQTTSLHRTLHQLLPAALHAQQQVLDQNHVLFLAEVFQMSACLVQVDDAFPVGVHLGHKHLQREIAQRGEEVLYFKRKRQMAFELSEEVMCI